MTLAQNLRLACTAAMPITACIVAGLPALTAMTHGLELATWPVETMNPTTWLQHIGAFNIPEIVAPYRAMMDGTSPAFVGGGRTEFWALLASAAGIPLVHILGMRTTEEHSRDPSGQLGNARFSNAHEKALMVSGLELGTDPDTGKPVRVAMESNALTIAPPRSGKTSGFIIPNLLVPDAGAWSGPVVLIDPKGEVYAATARRREELGRRVVRFDLRRDARPVHQWNPLVGIALDDIERLIAMARVLVVEASGQNAYFSDRAVDLLAGTMSAELLDASRGTWQPTMRNVARLLSAPDELLAIAQTGDNPILRSLCADLRLDERSRDQLISTAKTAISWLNDERFAQLTASSTFSMEDVVRGRIDLFIILSPSSARLLAPLLRLMLADLMSRALTDRHAGDDRLLVMIDEAASLGRFSELQQSVGLLPGLGVSFWTFWQSMSQIRQLYGVGSQVFVDSAELVTMSDFSPFGQDAEDFSKALGNYTAFVESTSAQQSASGKSSSTSRAKQAVPLMTAEALRNLRPDEMIVLLNSKRYSRRPLRLHKVKYFASKRFAGLYGDVTPTKAL